MSDFDFNINMTGALNKIKRAKAAMGKVPQAMNRGGLFFIGDIQEEFYSGRKSDDTSLNVGHGSSGGRLRSSWFPNVMTSGIDTVLRVVTDVPYARVHEEGSPKQGIPKRTDVVKEWEEKGLQMVRKEVLEVMP